MEPSESCPRGSCEFCRLSVDCTLPSVSPKLSSFFGIDFHAHRRSGAAADEHLAHALDLRELLRQDGGGQVIDLGHVVLVRRERQDHDGRVGGIDFAIRRIRRQVGGQIGARRIDGGLHVARCAVDVAAQIELQRDAGRSRANSTTSSR